jgi:SAM-dependent methyltransferase
MNILSYLGDYFTFLRQSIISKRWRDSNLLSLSPHLGDDSSGHGFDRHYIYHTAWAARKIVEIKPGKHVDLSSILYFSAIMSAFVPVEFYDYRKANVELNNLKSGKADLTELPFKTASISSLSCMHVVEHIGLGRYGDRIDADGDLKAIGELKRVLARNGNLLFVVPLGRPRVVFNAHRIYSYNQIINYFDGLSPKEFALIPDRGSKIMVNPSVKVIAKQNYGCGCFWFMKK